MSEWRVVVNDEETLTQDDGLYDVLVVDTFNPFGSFGEAMLDDTGGELFDKFTRGTKVELVYEAERTDGFESAFVGYVVQTPEGEANGADQLKVKAFTFDQFLRGGQVSADLSGSLISDALETVITEDVPAVEFVASQIDVVDDKELTESYQGDNIEEFLLSVRTKSGNELPEVLPDLTFQFAPAEPTRTERDIGNSDWVTHNITEDGAETRNQVTVSYDNGNRAIQVDNAADQLDISRNLGAPGPGVQGKTITRPKITNVNDAIAAGEQFLRGRAASLTGSVTVTELNDAQPGQVVNINVEPRGIDGDFRIAENRTRWLSETNELVVVAKKGADDDILLEQSRTLDRVSNRDADPSVQPDITTDTKPRSSVEVTAEVTGATTERTVAAGDTLTVSDTDPQTFEFVTVHGTLSIEQTGQSGTDDIVTVSPSSTVNADVARFVNTGRNRLRDAILAGTTLTAFEIGFSPSDDRPIRSDENISGPLRTAEVVNFDLTNDVTVDAGDTLTVPAGEVRPTSRVVVSGTLTVNGELQVLDKPATSFDADLQDAVETRTVGLIESATDNLIALARLEEPLPFVNTAQLAISFGPDAEPTTTFTRQGLEFLSQVLANVPTSFPATYAYGSDDTLPALTDTALGDEVIDTNFDETIVQEADSDAEWQSILNLQSTDPTTVSGGKLQNLQTSFFFEAEDAFFLGGEISDNDASAGAAESVFSSVHDSSTNFSLDYTLPDGNAGLAIRVATPNGEGPEIDFLIDGNIVQRFARDFQIGGGGFSWITRTASIGDLSPGSHSVEIDTVQSSTNGENALIDAVVVFDGRFTPTFDNQVDGDGFLDSPTPFPEQTVIDTQASINVDAGFDRARLRTTWDDTGNQQFIGVSADGNSFVTEDNTQVTTQNIGNTQQAFARFGISNYSPNGARQQSPRLGYESQKVDTTTLAAIGDNLRAEDIGALRLQALIQGTDAVGETFAEAGLKAADGTLLTRSLVPEFAKQQGQKVFSSEILSWQNEDSA